MTTFVFAWSRYLAEEGSYWLFEAKDEKDARRQAREATNVRTTRGAYVAEAETFRAALVALVELNASGGGVVRKLDRRRETLDHLTRALAAAAVAREQERSPA